MNNNKPYIDFGIKWGLIIGLILAVFTNILWFVNIDWMFNPIISSSIALINLVVFILLLVMVGKKARALTNYITVKQAFTTLLTVVLVHIAISAVFSYGIDAVTKEAKEAKLIEMKQKMVDDLEAKGVDEEQIEKSVAMMDKFSGKSSFMLILGVLLRTVIDIVIAYIIASTIKRLPPAEAVQETETT
jgi:hypothetical protein